MNIKKSLALWSVMILIFTFILSSCKKEETTSTSDTSSDSTSSAISTDSASSNVSSEGGMISSEASDSNSSSITETLTSTESNVSDVTGDTSSEARTFVIGTLYIADHNQNPGYSVYCDAFNNKLSEISTALNVNFQFKSYNGDTIIDEISKSILAGDQPFDLLEASNNVVRQLGISNMLYDQTQIGTIDLTASQYCQAAIQNQTFNGKTYGSSFGPPSASYQGIFFNKKLIEEYTDYDIYELYNNKEWTFDKFKEIAKATTVVNNGNTEIYGITGTTTLVGLAITANAGGTVTRTSEGKYVVGMATSAGIEAMNFVRSIYITDKSYYYNGVFQTCADLFINGQAAFFPFSITYCKDFGQEMLDDFGFVPMPIGYQQSDYINGVYDVNTYAIPKTIADASFSGEVYQNLSGLGSTLESIMAEQLADWGLDEQGIQVYKDMKNYLSSEYIGGVDVSEFNDAMNDSIYKANGDPASVMSSVKTKFQTAVNDYYAQAN